MLRVLSREGKEGQALRTLSDITTGRFHRTGDPSLRSKSPYWDIKGEASFNHKRRRRFINISKRIHVLVTNTGGVPSFGLEPLWNHSVVHIWPPDYDTIISETAPRFIEFSYDSDF